MKEPEENNAGSAPEMVRADDKTIVKHMLISISELDVPISFVLEEYGRIVGYEPTGMHSNKMRDAQNRRDRAFRMIGQWEANNCHFTECDIPDWIKESNPERFREMMENFKTWNRSRNIVFLNGVMHFDYGGLEDIATCLWTFRVMSKEEAINWKTDFQNEKSAKN